MSEMNEELGLYVHWPYCARICPYCDFNVYKAGAIDSDAGDSDKWRDAFEKELRHWHNQTNNRLITSIYFGGGTPSLMSGATVERVLDAIAGLWNLSPGAEVTLEANPTSVEAGRFAGYRAAGVNRVSIGIQALDDTDLKALGRQHSATEALAALEVAKRHFERVSFDLIYARPRQSLADWHRELGRALATTAWAFAAMDESDAPLFAWYAILAVCHFGSSLKFRLVAELSARSVVLGHSEKYQF